MTLIQVIAGRVLSGNGSAMPAQQKELATRTGKESQSKTGGRERRAVARRYAGHETDDGYDRDSTECPAGKRLELRP